MAQGGGSSNSGSGRTIVEYLDQVCAKESDGKYATLAAFVDGFVACYNDQMTCDMQHMTQPVECCYRKLFEASSSSTDIELDVPLGQHQEQHMALIDVIHDIVTPGPVDVGISLTHPTALSNSAAAADGFHFVEGPSFKTALASSSSSLFSDAVIKSRLDLARCFRNAEPDDLLAFTFCVPAASFPAEALRSFANVVHTQLRVIPSVALLSGLVCDWARRLQQQDQGEFPILVVTSPGKSTPTALIVSNTLLEQELSKNRDAILDRFRTYHQHFLALNKEPMTIRIHALDPHQLQQQQQSQEEKVPLRIRFQFNMLAMAPRTRPVALVDEHVLARIIEMQLEVAKPKLPPAPEDCMDM